jgi:hypothetical protein
MPIVISLNQKQRTFFWTEQEAMQLATNVVLPGTPRNPFFPPDVIKVFDTIEQANEKAKEIDQNCKVMDLAPSVLEFLKNG